MTRQKSSRDGLHNWHVVQYLEQLWIESSFLKMWEENLSAWIRWRKELGEFKEVPPVRAPYNKE